MNFFRDFQFARVPLIFGLMLLILTFAFLVSLSVGVAPISLLEVWNVLLSPNQSLNSLIIETLRLPRAIVAVLAGACLAVSGGIMQGITRNPLASPSLLGVNAGAALFMLLGFLFAPQIPSTLLAFIGGFVMAFLVLSLSARVGLQPLHLILAGVAVGAFCTALANGILIVFAEQTKGAFISLIGSLAGRTWVHVNTIVPLATVALTAAFFSSQVLNVIALGDDSARALGVRVRSSKVGFLFLAVVLATTAVSVVGPIAFLGLIAPHLARGLIGADYRLLLPLAALLGSSLLCLADVAARMVNAPLETPVGILIAALGAPFFIYLARRS
jgi:iron complex transport system permease protein